MTTDPLPGVLQELEGELLRRGFGRVGERHDPRSFGNRLVDFSDDELTLRFLKDRGHWFVEIAGPLRGWFDPPLWEACLNDEVASVRLVPIETQVRFVKAHLDDVERLHRGGEAVQSRLERLRRARAESGRALDPDDGRNWL